MVDKSISLEWRQHRAMEMREKGYNCAQSVLLAFPDLSDLSDVQLARISAALGSGVAASAEICGVPNAIAILVGLCGGAKAEDKVTATKKAKPIITAFQEQNDGRLRCHDLKLSDARRSCNELILQGIELLHNVLQ